MDKGRDMDFTDKRVLVTGSSRGVGRATAQKLLDCGARVAVNGRTADSTAAGIVALGSDARLVAAPGHIGTVAGCEAAIAAAVGALGGLDILVNNAGVSHDGPIENYDEATWDETLGVNLKGTFFCIKAALPALRASRGNIVNVASDAGLMGDVNLSVYCASKGGVVNLTRALALELAPDIRVNCVCPGFIDTDMGRNEIEKADDPAAAEQALIDYSPMKRFATPEEIGQAIAYLASDDARYITGAAFQIDGGTTAGR
jgi:NAD(P)-dependent dehydrogenase (short-subunit alcohol dehydrogenase family)